MSRRVGEVGQSTIGEQVVPEHREPLQAEGSKERYKIGRRGGGAPDVRQEDCGIEDESIEMTSSNSFHRRAILRT